MKRQSGRRHISTISACSLFFIYGLSLVRLLWLIVRRRREGEREWRVPAVLQFIKLQFYDAMKLTPDSVLVQVQQSAGYFPGESQALSWRFIPTLNYGKKDQDFTIGITGIHEVYLEYYYCREIDFLKI